MAKGNMFQGMARGKVGDVVFSRVNGQQVSRVRNRTPKNPRSNAQMIQRAVMATIMQAYSAGKAIFDHSFEGKSVGSANQREFMRRNLPLLRAAVGTDYSNGNTDADCVARVIAPKSGFAVPGPYVVSNGKLPQTLYNAKMELAWPTGTNVAEQTFGDFLTTFGAQLIPGDIYTLVVIECGGREVYGLTNGNEPYLQQFESAFAYVQLKVKSQPAWTDEQKLRLCSAVPVTDVFEIYDFAGIELDTALTLTASVITGDNLTFEGQNAYAGVIRSRDDSGLRSSCTLENIHPDGERNYGLATNYLLDAWKADTSSIGQSDLILEGSNF